MDPLDDPRRVADIKNKIRNKASLQDFYAQVYSRYAACLTRCPQDGCAVELGTRAGFTKDVIPEITTSDVIPYQGIDCVLDGQALPFKDASCRFIGMVNVFHHISDVGKFLHEIQRCLMTGGRMLVVDQHPGCLGKPIYRYLHHEDFDDQAQSWKFTSSGPVSGANGALAWIVFVRDRQTFEQTYPGLELSGYRTHTPLYYWLSGGLKWWTLVPKWGIGTARALDRGLLNLSADLGSFVDIELVRRSGP